MTDKHASWENFGSFMERNQMSKPVIVPARVKNHMMALAQHAGKRNVSLRSAIAFAIIVEYIVADLLENAGIIAGDEHDIDVKHVLKAIRRDPEHAAIFKIPESRRIKSCGGKKKKKMKKDAESQ